MCTLHISHFGFSLAKHPKEEASRACRVATKAQISLFVSLNLLQVALAWALHAPCFDKGIQGKAARLYCQRFARVAFKSWDCHHWSNASPLVFWLSSHDIVAWCCVFKPKCVSPCCKSFKKATRVMAFFFAGLIVLPEIDERLHTVPRNLPTIQDFQDSQTPSKQDREAKALPIIEAIPSHGFPEYLGTLCA